MPRLAIVLVLAAAALPALVSGPPRVAACSIAHPMDALRSGKGIEATVIVSGLVTKSERGVAHVRVERGFKGAKRGDVLTVNNHLLDLGAGCDVSINSARQVRRFNEGTHYALLLVPDDLRSGADYRPAFLGFWAFPLDGEALVSEDGPARLPAPAAVVEAIRANAQAQAPYDIENTPPCNPPYTPDLLAVVPTYTVMSTLVVRGSISSADPDVAVVRVDETYRGKAAGPTIRVSNRAIDRRHDGRCGIAEPEPRGQPIFQPGGDVILFLVPDEAGVADWRVATWGLGKLAIRADRVAPYPGPVILDDLQEIAKTAVDPPPGVPAASPLPDEAEWQLGRRELAILVFTLGLLGGLTWRIYSRRER